MDAREHKRLIKSHLAGQDIASLYRNTDGWDNDLYIVNDHTVFRFPKTSEVADKVIHEARLLKALHTKNPMLAIPKYSLLYSKDRKFTGVCYPKISGQTLTDVKPSLVCTTANAKLIADFLTKLHHLPFYKQGLVGEFNNFLTTAHWKNLFSSIEMKLFPYFKDLHKQEISDTFSRFIMSHPTYSKTFVHGDLTPSNILIDQEKQTITGIVDFTDAMWTDPAFDFGGFYWNYGGNFTKEILSHYETYENKDDIYQRICEFYGLQSIFHDMLYARRHKLKFDWDAAISTFIKRKYEQS